MSVLQKIWKRWKEAGAYADAEVARLKADGYFEAQASYRPSLETEQVQPFGSMLHDGFFEQKAAVQHELGVKHYDSINLMTYHTPVGTAQRIYQGSIYKGVRV